MVGGEKDVVPCYFHGVDGMRIIIINNTGGKK